VLNSAPLSRYIPLSTKTSIKTAAKSLGYRPNPFARWLRDKCSHTVGVIIFDITDPYCTGILRGIQNTLYRSSFLPIIIDVQNDRAHFGRYLELLLDRRVDGLITIANSLSLDVRLLGTLLEGEQKIPKVTIGREPGSESISHVVIDNVAGARAALGHLYELGHRKIAFIKGPGMLVDARQRWEGILSFSEEKRLKIDSELVVTLKDASLPYEGGYNLMRLLLRRKHPFTALMAFDDLTAFGAMRGLIKAGRHVPRNCSVVGFDDAPMGAFYNPPLTTVRQPMEELGSIGARILAEAIRSLNRQKEFIPTRRKIIPKLIIRDSTGRLVKR
jgi:LacI family transcriptional regulator